MSSVLNWNLMEVETSPEEALGLFVRLLLGAGHHEAVEALKGLDEQSRRIVRLLTENETTAGYSPATVVHAVHRFTNALADIHDGFGKGVDCKVRTELGSVTFVWNGQFTADRWVEAKISSNAEQGAVVRFGTGTGKPSRFLAAFCAIAAQKALDEIKEVFGLIR